MNSGTFKKGHKHSEETKKKMSLLKLGKSRNGNPLNWKHSEETKRKISLIIKNRIILGLFIHPRGTLGKHPKHPLQSEETKRKISNSLIGRFRGENSPSWKGGLYARKRRGIRGDSAYQAWIKEIKNRDKGICRLQNDNCKSGYMVAHHILSWREYPEERYNINNGITLCQYHHPRKHNDERRLIPVFQELVGSK